MAISSCPVALNLSWNHPGGDRRAGHARPAGRARVPEATNPWLEKASFRTALTASAAALLLIVAAATTALLMSAPGTAASAARNDPAGTPATSVASPQPRAITVP
jgi:hypothetical protein